MAYHSLHVSTLERLEYSIYAKGILEESSEVNFGWIIDIGILHTDQPISGGVLPSGEFTAI